MLLYNFGVGYLLSTLGCADVGRPWCTVDNLSKRLYFRNHAFIDGLVGFLGSVLALCMITGLIPAKAVVFVLPVTPYSD